MFASPPPSLIELSGTSSISALALAGQLQRSEPHKKVFWVIFVAWNVCVCVYVCVYIHKVYVPVSVCTHALMDACMLSDLTCVFVLLPIHIYIRTQVSSRGSAVCCLACVYFFLGGDGGSLLPVLSWTLNTRSSSRPLQHAPAELVRPRRPTCL